MPDIRALIIGIGVGGGVGGYLTLWWHWPLAIGGGIGIVLGGLALIGTMSVGRDPTIDDDAWRKAAPEFVDAPAEPTAGVSPRPASAQVPASPQRGHDLPSGD
jgi:hypothetical protein